MMKDYRFDPVLIDPQVPSNTINEKVIFNGKEMELMKYAGEDAKYVIDGEFDNETGTLYLINNDKSVVEITGFLCKNNSGKGIIGPQGVPGQDGRDGRNGKDGIPGAVGLRGPKGNTGLPGNPGQKGEQGDKGEVGQQGSIGDEGLQGLPGLKGDDGQKGLPGNPGPPGLPGPKGRNGYSIKSVSSKEGILYFTLSDGKSYTVPLCNVGKGTVFGTIPTVIETTQEEVTTTITTTVAPTTESTLPPIASPFAVATGTLETGAVIPMPMSYTNANSFWILSTAFAGDNASANFEGLAWFKAASTTDTESKSYLGWSLQNDAAYGFGQANYLSIGIG